MAIRLPGCNYYRVIVSDTYDFDTLVQAPDEETARQRTVQKFPHHRIVSITLNNYWWLESHKGVCG